MAAASLSEPISKSEKSISSVAAEKLAGESFNAHFGFVVIMSFTVLTYYTGAYRIPSSGAVERDWASFLATEVAMSAMFATCLSMAKILTQFYPMRWCVNGALLSMYVSYALVMVATVPEQHFLVGVSTLLGVLLVVPVLIAFWLSTMALGPPTTLLPNTHRRTMAFWLSTIAFW